MSQKEDITWQSLIDRYSKELVYSNFDNGYSFGRKSKTSLLPLISLDDYTYTLFLIDIKETIPMGAILSPKEQLYQLGKEESELALVLQFSKTNKGLNSLNSLIGYLEELREQFDLGGATFD